MSLLLQRGPRPLLSSGVTFVRGLRGLPSDSYRAERVTTNSDGSVIVCWHPEPKFPYQMTRPMPRAQDRGTDSKYGLMAIPIVSLLHGRSYVKYL